MHEYLSKRPSILIGALQSPQGTIRAPPYAMVVTAPALITSCDE